jgi:hypothetical protein
MTRVAALVVLSMLFPVFAGAQARNLVEPWPVTPMPPDRAEDSYAIYSTLLPLGETADRPATFLAVQDATITAVQPDAPCAVPEATDAMSRARSGGMNPHVNVTAPKGDRQDYDEVLADFDAHCHERLALTAESWRTRVPVHLLNETEQSEFRTTRNTQNPAAEKYKGTPALFAFSQIYFNTHHTVALVYATHWCGGLCGQGFWVAFQKENGAWKRLDWSAVSWIS